MGSIASAPPPRFDKSAYISFAIGAFLALLQWGLGLIGITLNLWLGAGVLLLAFALITHAVCVVLPPLTQRPYLRRILKVISILVATGMYAALVVPRVIKEFRPIEQQANAPVKQGQPADVRAPLAKQTPPSATKLSRQLHLNFKNSPLFTRACRNMLQDELEEFYRYLSTIGFEPQRDLPPFEVVPGRAIGIVGTGGGTIYDEKLIIGDQQLNDRIAVLRLYAHYVFGKIFHTTDRTDLDRLFEDNTVGVFSVYYISSFSDTDLYHSAPNPWQSALWEIRSRYGAEFVDKSLFFAFKTWRQRTATEVDFNTFFANRFRYGVYVEDNFLQKTPGVIAILRAHELITQ